MAAAPNAPGLTTAAHTGWASCYQHSHLLADGFLQRHTSHSAPLATHWNRQGIHMLGSSLQPITDGSQRVNTQLPHSSAGMTLRHVFQIISQSFPVGLSSSHLPFIGCPPFSNFPPSATEVSCTSKINCFHSFLSQELLLGETKLRHLAGFLFASWWSKPTSLYLLPKSD